MLLFLGLLVCCCSSLPAPRWIAATALLRPMPLASKQAHIFTTAVGGKEFVVKVPRTAAETEHFLQGLWVSTISTDLGAMAAAVDEAMGWIESSAAPGLARLAADRVVLPSAIVRNVTLQVAAAAAAATTLPASAVLVQQRAASVFHDALQQAVAAGNMPRAKELLDAAMALHLRMWRRGVFERYLNVMQNAAVTADGTVLWMDLGDFFFDDLAHVLEMALPRALARVGPGSRMVEAGSGWRFSLALLPAPANTVLVDHWLDLVARHLNRASITAVWGTDRGMQGTGGEEASAVTLPTASRDWHNWAATLHWRAHAVLHPGIKMRCKADREMKRCLFSSWWLVCRFRRGG